VVPSIPEDVLRFIEAHIDSVHRLDALLLVRREPDRWWREAEIAAELRGTVDSARLSLTVLAEHGLLEFSPDSPPAFRYRPRTDALGLLADRLAAAYATHRVAVIEAIYARPAENVRSFADAFRWRKDD
jgi:hypothetical protein